jgi:hypothetical protein
MKFAAFVRCAAAGVAGVVLAGCAALAPPSARPGQTEAEVLASLGRPTAAYRLPAGRRLEFATGPYGRTTWMVDLDAAGGVVDARQVLTDTFLADFQARAPGMPRDELLRTLGTPGERRGVGWQGGETWSWRYVTHDCLWFQVSVDRAGVVQSAGFAIDPACDAPNDRD